MRPLPYALPAKANGLRAAEIALPMARWSRVRYIHPGWLGCSRLNSAVILGDRDPPACSAVEGTCRNARNRRRRFSPIPVGATVAPLTLTQVIVVRIHDREHRRPYRLEA